jgi:enolase
MGAGTDVNPSTIASLSALEILDSRGRPTLKVACSLGSGASATASVPSGASRGAAEAAELRDGDAARHAGLGCRRAVRAVEGEIASTVCGNRFAGPDALDGALRELDGTPTKSRLGANTILGVSLAFARAAAAEAAVPFYRYLARLADIAPAMPRPFVNLFSGGAHAGGQVGVQDVQLLVQAAANLDEALTAVADIYREAAALSAERFAMRLLRADEGGLAPPVDDSEQMLALAVECIERTGRKAHDDVLLAVDVAASQLVVADGYELDGRRVDLVDVTSRWLRDYPIVSLEDPLAEEDWSGWKKLARRAGNALLVGDDLLCTQVERIERARELACANALLLKPNQVGTLTEALAALRAARDGGWAIVVSARSGDTEDDWLADLAVGWAAEHVKIGSITQSERLAKYNRLLAIEREIAQRDGNAASRWRTPAER